LEQLAINSFGANQQSEALMRQALERDPSYVAAMVGLIDTWLTMQRTGQITAAGFQKRALPILDRIEAIDPRNAQTLANRAEIANERGEHATAVRLAQQAVAAAPGIARLHIILATIYIIQRDPAAAVPELEQAVALNQLDANFVRFRATALRFAGRLDEARQATQQALRLDPKNGSNYWELSMIEYGRGDLVAAIVQSAISMDID